jgi:hypothetical protein
MCNSAPDGIIGGDSGQINSVNQYSRDRRMPRILAIRYNSRYDWSRPQTVPGLEPPYPEP